jgi:hypothetical protein
VDFVRRVQSEILVLRELAVVALGSSFAQGLASQYARQVTERRKGEAMVAGTVPLRLVETEPEFEDLRLELRPGHGARRLGGGAGSSSGVRGRGRSWQPSARSAYYEKVDERHDCQLAKDEYLTLDLAPPHGHPNPQVGLDRP